MPSAPLLGRPSHYSYLKELHAKNFSSDVSQRPWITNNTTAHHISELSQPRVLWNTLLAYPSVHTSIFLDRRIVKWTLYLAPIHLSKQCSLQHQLHSSTRNLHMVTALGGQLPQAFQYQHLTQNYLPWNLVFFIYCSLFYFVFPLACLLYHIPWNKMLYNVHEEKHIW